MDGFKFFIATCILLLNYGCAKPLSNHHIGCANNEDVPNREWTKLTEANVTDIVIYEKTIYGIGVDKGVWKYVGRHHQDEWKKVIDGNVTSISIHDEQLYAVRDGKAVWRCPVHRCRTWEKLTEVDGDGVNEMSRIVVRDGFIFGVREKSNDVFQTTYDGYWPWRRVSRESETSIVDIAFTSNFMYGVGRDGAVWKSPKDGSWPWKRITKSKDAKRIACSKNYIYTVSKDNSMWRSAFGKGDWKMISGNGTMKAVALHTSSCGGTDVYGVGVGNGVWKMM